MKSGPLPVLYDKLESFNEEIYENIIRGETYQFIANSYNVSLGTLFKFLYNDKNSLKTQEARQFASHVLVDKAEEVLAQAKEDPKLTGIASQLAHHYRWKASMLNPKNYEKRLPKPEDEGKKEITITVIEE